VATGEPVALIDAADALDPRSVPAEVRPHLLWVRPKDVLTSLKCADLLLDAGGFALVALYLVDVRELSRTRASLRATWRQGVGSAAWARLAQRAEHAHSGLLVTLDDRSAYAPGAFAHVSLAVERHGVVWRKHQWLESVQSEIVVERARGVTHSDARHAIERRGEVSFAVA
jgi:hypothetical protein